MKDKIIIIGSGNFVKTALVQKIKEENPDLILEQEDLDSINDLLNKAKEVNLVVNIFNSRKGEYLEIPKDGKANRRARRKQKRKNK